MYTSKKHTSNTCAWQCTNPDQPGSSINLQHNYYTSNIYNDFNTIFVTITFYITGTALSVGSYYISLPTHTLLIPVLVLGLDRF